MEERQKYQYWLRCIQGLGNKKLKNLVEYCGSAKEAYHLTERQLSEVQGLGGRDVEAVLESKKKWNLEKEVEVLKEKGISMITIEEEAFPERLRYIVDCPYALFYKGSLPEEEMTAAIVGARMCSSYGRAAALELGQKLAARGVGIISGMAAGIDSFGHWGAIKGGGKTYAVLGCGTDICYPRGGRELYGRIPDCGGILSEYIPGTTPEPGRFPARNRIISALADVVIIVEAKKRSGSLITADFALDQGKEIYAVPGRLDDALSGGCNELIRQGAGIITSADQLLEELGFSMVSEGSEEDSRIKNIKNSLEKAELLVYSCFGFHARTMEELVKMTKIPVSELADLLIRLQNQGLIEVL